MHTKIRFVLKLIAKNKSRIIRLEIDLILYCTLYSNTVYIMRNISFTMLLQQVFIIYSSRF